MVIVVLEAEAVAVVIVAVVAIVAFALAGLPKTANVWTVCRVMYVSACGPSLATSVAVVTALVCALVPGCALKVHNRLWHGVGVVWVVFR